MTINEEYAMELLLGGHLRGKGIDEGYCVFFQYEAEVTKPVILDKWLLDNDYLRKPTIEEALSWYQLPQLKAYLTELGQKKTGKKDELITRIVSNAPRELLDSELEKCTKYYLSEKGLRHYYDNIDLEHLHEHWEYHISLEEYFEHRYMDGVFKNFYKIARSILSNRIFDNCRDARRLSGLDFGNLSEVCEELNENYDSMYFALMKLFVDVNMVSVPWHFDGFFIETNGIGDICSRMIPANFFNLHTISRILSHSDYYSDRMVDDIYELKITSHILLEKPDFISAVHDMMNNAHFKSDDYMRIIKENYKKLAEKILEEEQDIDPDFDLA